MAREHLFGLHEDHPGFNAALARPVPPVAAELCAEKQTLFDEDEGRPTDGIYEIRTNELDLGVVRQSGPNEMDVTVDSVEIPAVVDSSVVTRGESGVAQ